MVVVRTNFVAGATEVILELRFNVGLDFILAMTRSSQIDGGCCCFSALNAFWVIVGYIGRDSRHATNCIKIVKQPGHCGYTHS